MSKPKIIPDVNHALAAAVDKIYELIPSAFEHINTGKGKWANLIAGWRAQGNLVVRRFADESKSTRLFCEADSLRQLCSSEYSITLSPDPTFAIGEVELYRELLPRNAGVIRKGTIFTKTGDPDAQPLAITSAKYVSSQDVLVKKGQFFVTVPIVAVSAGPSSNTIITSVNDISIFGSAPILPATPLFDTNFSVTQSHCAGGSLNPASDQVLRRIAKAFTNDRVGPIEGATLVGALLYSGVSNAVVLENEVNARTVIFPVDESWGYSDSLNNAVGQLVKNSTLGFGCSIQMGKTINRFIHIEADIQLIDSKYLLDTTDITNSISTALTSYFNDRPDWYTWKTSTVQSVISSASRKIFGCTSATITDATTSNVISETPPIVLDNTNPVLTHYYLANNSFAPNFLPPP